VRAERAGPGGDSARSSGPSREDLRSARPGRLRRLHPRLRLDLGWGDLFFAATASAWAGGPARRAQRIETRFSARGDAFAALSARSGFDLYLSALALPAESEVLVAGLTIPHMVQILAAHGLRAVPFALDPSTLQPAPGELERRATPRTRAVLFAHLFGQRADLGALAAMARRERWLLWEDCAQAFTGDEWRGEPEADLALFSFGLIKTATAIQGGILRVRDAAVRERMRAQQTTWAVQRRTDFLRRVGKASVLHALSNPWLFACFAGLCARRGRDLDELLHTATRGFPGPDFLQRLRRLPSAPLLALLERRLRRPWASSAGRRRTHGETLLSEVGERLELFGRHARERHHWVFAVGCPEPAQLVRALRAAGFDATARSSLVPVEPAAGGAAPGANRALLQRLVYVPLAPDAADGERAELVRILRASVSTYELAPHGAFVRAAHPPPG
jgi:dTDP-4-amino-4,6-dideoxygalactose transaminase